MCVYNCTFCVELLTKTSRVYRILWPRKYFLIRPTANIAQTCINNAASFVTKPRRKREAKEQREAKYTHISGRIQIDVLQIWHPHCSDDACRNNNNIFSLYCNNSYHETLKIGFIHSFNML